MIQMNIQGKRSLSFFLLIGFFILAIGIWGTIRLKERPGIGAALEKPNEHLQVVTVETGSSAATSGVEAGDLLLAVDENPVESTSDLNFFLDQKEIGEPARLTLLRDGQKMDLIVPLERKNSALFLLVNFLAGLFLWGVGVFVFLKSPRSQITTIFLMASLSFSLALFISWEGFPYGPEGLSFILPSLQIIAYTLIPALFLHFSMIFPREETPSRSKLLIYSVYLPGLVLILLMHVFYWRSISLGSLSLFQGYKTLFLYFRIYLVACVLLGLGALYQTYRGLEFVEDRRKIKWIFWGIAAGTFPFIFLHTLPQVAFGRGLVPEVVNYLFMLLIPVAFAFSILRYQAMDVDVIINRSLVYSLLAGCIVVVYLFVVELAGEIIHRLTGYRGSLFLILAGIAAALIFTPAKNRIKLFVDRTLYRVRYDYRRAIQKFIRQVNSAFTQEELLDLLFRKVDVLLAVNRTLIFLRDDESAEFKIVGWKGFSEEEIKEIESEKDGFLGDLVNTRCAQASLRSTAFREIPVLPENRILKRFDIRLSFPLMAKEGLLGLLLIGKKESGVRYSVEDMELLSLMVQEEAQAMENVKMRKKVMAERLEREKLEELDKLKTKFLSNVSHDLRTPLTSIQLSVDNMLQGVYGKVSEASQKHLRMIKESTLHVSRMIDNLLTLSTSDAGRIVLNKERLSLGQVVDQALGVTEPSAEKKGIGLVREQLNDMLVFADRHSLLQILINLLDNSIKYTSSGGTISVSARKIEDEKFVEISVADDGVGISPGNLEKIFERFQKVTPAGRMPEKGLGIGLDIVKNLVHLHGGEIKVESPVADTGKGSKFSFTLPLT